MYIAYLSDTCLLVDGLKVHSSFKLLPKSYLAITLFGHVFFRMNIDKLIDFLSTEAGMETINHEKIHMLQAESFKLKYFTFYILYVWYWFTNLFKQGDAYMNIPFEKEAYANDENYFYNTTNWKSYI